MKCKTAQRWMALAVGEDLAPAEMQVLQGHLQKCPKCRQTWDVHQRSFAVLQHSRTNDVQNSGSSIWPVLSHRLRERAAAPQRSEFNGWIAALAVTAACVLVFVFSQEDGTSTAARSPQAIVPRGSRLSAPADLRNAPAPMLRRDSARPRGTFDDGTLPVLDRP